MKIYDDDIGEVILIDSMGEDATPAHAARVSFAHLHQERSEDVSEKDEKLIRYLATNGHTSPFEHISASFELTVPLFVARQIMRHRTFSFNEVSRRYTSKDISVYHPISIKQQAVDNLQCSSNLEVQESVYCQKLIEGAASTALAIYNELIKRGVARETARSVLPVATYTSFWMTGNLHNFMKFIKLRTSPHAQLETRLAAEAIRVQLLERYPVSMSALTNE